MRANLAERLTPPTWADFEVTAGLILGYGVLVNLLVPEAFYVPANLAASGATVYLASRMGLTVKDMGLEPERIPSGLRRGLVASAPVSTAIALAVAVPWTRRYFLDSKIINASTGRALYEMLLRVPFGTSLSEELLFRGVLLGLSLRRYRPWVAIAISSAVFGAWHILPTMQSMTTNEALSNRVDTGLTAKAGAVAGVVAATALAGVVFSRLRLRCGSIVAPWIVHSALNSLSYLGGRIGAHPGEGS